ncbi:MAG: hypothetical protein ACLTR4_12490 [Gallintestinimicrobium sp.]
MKLTEKAKRYLLVLGGILLCAGLLVAIWFQLKPEAVPEERFEAETGEVTEITVDMEQEEEKGQGAQNGDGIVETEPESLQAETESETESGETAQDGLENGADDGQEKDTVQSIQLDVKKPEVPEEALKTRISSREKMHRGNNGAGGTSGGRHGWWTDFYTGLWLGGK